MNRQKVLGDSILTTRDAIYTLQMWLRLLESWQNQDQVEPEEFAYACQQLKQAELWHWVRQAGGHGLEALAKAVGVEDFRLNSRRHEEIQQ